MDADQLLAMYNLYGNYCHSVDTHDEAAIRACFTDDAILDVSQQTRGGDVVKTSVEGQEAIVDRMMTVSTGRPGFMHETFNIVLKATEGADEFHGLASFRVLTPTSRPEAIGRYTDVLVRDGGVWRFRKRTVGYTWRDTWDWVTDSV